MNKTAGKEGSCAAECYKLGLLCRDWLCLWTLPLLGCVTLASSPTLSALDCPCFCVPFLWLGKDSPPPLIERRLLDTRGGRSCQLEADLGARVGLRQRLGHRFSSGGSPATVGRIRGVAMASWRPSHASSFPNLNLCPGTLQISFSAEITQSCLWVRCLSPCDQDALGAPGFSAGQWLHEWEPASLKQRCHLSAQLHRGPTNAGRLRLGVFYGKVLETSIRNSNSY